MITEEKERKCYLFLTRFITCHVHVELQLTGLVHTNCPPDERNEPQKQCATQMKAKKLHTYRKCLKLTPNNITLQWTISVYAEN